MSDFYTYVDTSMKRYLLSRGLCSMSYMYIVGL